jgi:hypothetical protein
MYFHIVKYLIIIFFILLYNSNYAQSDNLVIIGSAGNSTIVGNNQLSWTIGETIINTAITSNVVLTQGFHQGNYIISVIEENNKINATIYPNPTTNELVVSIGENDLKNAKYKLKDSFGKLMIEGNITNTKTNLLLESVPSASYFIQVILGNQVKTFKIIKQ